MGTESWVYTYTNQGKAELRERKRLRRRGMALTRALLEAECSSSGAEARALRDKRMAVQAMSNRVDDAWATGYDNVVQQAYASYMMTIEEAQKVCDEARRALDHWKASG